MGEDLIGYATAACPDYGHLRGAVRATDWPPVDVFSAGPRRPSQGTVLIHARSSERLAGAATCPQGNGHAPFRPDVRAESLYGGPIDPHGVRVLVERSLPLRPPPRSVLPDLWAPELAPSRALRRWYGLTQSRFEEFALRYEQELQKPAAQAELLQLRDLALDGPLILQVADIPVRSSHGAVLAQHVLRMVEEATVDPLGGDAACWLDQVCPECGRIPDGPVADICPNCHAGRTE